MSAVAETAVLFLGIGELALTGVLARQLPARRRPSTSTATPNDTRAAADTTPVALGSIPGFAESQRSMTPVALRPACDECGSRDSQKRGTRLNSDGDLCQQYACNECSHWFRGPLAASTLRRAS